LPCVTSITPEAASAFWVGVRFATGFSAGFGWPASGCVQVSAGNHFSISTLLSSVFGFV